MTNPSTSTSTLRRIATDEFGNEWFEIAKPGYVTQRFPAFVHGTWMQHVKYPYKGMVVKYSERDAWEYDEFKCPIKRVGKIIEDIWVMGWYQVCSIETYISWGLVSKEQVEAVGFQLRW